MKKHSKWVKTRHQVFYHLLRLPLKLYFQVSLHYRYKALKYDKKQRYIILSNHQTDMDPLIIPIALKRYPYPMATDTLLSNGTLSRLLSFFAAPIPIRKGTSDAGAVLNALRVVKEGGDILIFPEGNRTYAEFQYPIEESIVKLVKKSHLPLMLVNLKGGTGISPRFANKARKGKLTCEIKKIISAEEIDSTPNNELLKDIRENLKVYDSESGQLFRSNKKAEYLERMFFYCPICHKTETLHSLGNTLKCTCGLEVNYNENLTLSSANPEFQFNRLVDWYEEQKKFVRDMEIRKGEVIFSDPDVELYISHLYTKRKLVCKGTIKITDTELIFDNITIPLNQIQMASPISGKKFNFSTETESYIVIGHPRFNPLKYIFLFNRLDTAMKGNDIYYSL